MVRHDDRSRLVSRFALAILSLAVVGGAGCRSAGDGPLLDASSDVVPAGFEVDASSRPEPRKVLLERVDHVAIAQLYADGFEQLTTDERILAWHLYQAALAGRDIYYQQKCAEGVAIRDLMEEILTHSRGVDPDTLEEVRRYTKLFWVNSSPYDAMTAKKFVLQCQPEELVLAAQAASRAGATLPKRSNETIRNLIGRLEPILFDPDHEPQLTAKNPSGDLDVIEASAVTFYASDVTLEDLDGVDERYALNSTVRKTSEGKVEEAVWRAGDPWRGIPEGLFAEEIRTIIGHLLEASRVAPVPTRQALEALIRFYRTGEDGDRAAYDIAWVGDVASTVDTVNGFIEVYLDPRGAKGSWEGIVFYEDPKRSKEIKLLAEHAQWFEDHMPFEERFKKPQVKGISARSVDVLIETGDAGPVTAIGINLPNDVQIREQYGSKSVSLANVKQAYDDARPKSARIEFAWDDDEIRRQERWAETTATLLTNMHEVIGHASGRQADDRAGDPAQWLLEYSSALEEARADLIALYFMMDPKLVELELLGPLDEVAGASEEAALACYERYTKNGGMLQLRRVPEGDQLEQDHMRNRQLVVRWIQENSDAIEERERGGKRYLVVTDARAWREAAGELLSIVQRIKSTGDYEGARELFDTYGVTFDTGLRDEVMERYQALGLPAYTGFVMPRLTPVFGEAGAVIDVEISYPLSLEQQMLEWSGRRSAFAN